MTRLLRDYEQAEFERWVKIEYPDIAWLFDELPKTELPKTLTDFVREQLPCLLQEFIEGAQGVQDG